MVAINLKEPLKFEHLEIKGAAFNNADLTNISFKNSKLTNVQFKNTKLKDINFDGAEIDGKTLKNLLPAIRANQISIKGAKITGNVESMNLTGISLEDTDLTQVTSFKDTELHGTNFTNAALPTIEGKNIFADTYNLDRAIFGSELKNNNELNNLIDKERQSAPITLAKEVSYNLAKKHFQQNNENSNIPYDPDKDQNYYIILSNVTKLLHERDIVNAKLLDSLGNNITAIQNIKNYPIDKNKITNSDDLLSPEYAMTFLYTNIDKLQDPAFNLKSMQAQLLATKMADQVSYKLFGPGQGRGQDNLMLRNMYEDILVNEVAHNKNFNPIEFANRDDFNDICLSHSNLIRSKSNYTAMGLITGGIQLKENHLDLELKKELKNDLSLSEKEVKAIRDLADEATTKLEYSENSKVQIENHLKSAFLEIKSKMQLDGIDISNIINENKAKIIGNKDSEKGITGFYQKMEKSNLLGALYYSQKEIDPSKLKLGTQEAMNKVISIIKNPLQESKNPANKTAVQTAEKEALKIQKSVTPENATTNLKKSWAIKVKPPKSNKDQVMRK